MSRLTGRPSSVVLAPLFQCLVCASHVRILAVVRRRGHVARRRGHAPDFAAACVVEFQENEQGRYSVNAVPNGDGSVIINFGGEAVDAGAYRTKLGTRAVAT